MEIYIISNFKNEFHFWKIIIILFFNVKIDLRLQHSSFNACLAISFQCACCCFSSTCMQVLFFDTLVAPPLQCAYCFSSLPPNVILWIYPESMASHHIYLCILIFIIWKDTSFILMYKNMHCLNSFSKMSLVVVFTIFSHHFFWQQNLTGKFWIGAKLQTLMANTTTSINKHGILERGNG
jgi:hypothetical protein